MKKIIILFFICTATIYPQKFYKWDKRALPKKISAFITSGDGDVLAAINHYTEIKFYKSTNQGIFWEELPDFNINPANLLYENNSRIFYRQANLKTTYDLFYTDDLGVSSSLSQTDNNKIPEKLFETNGRLFLKYNSENALYVSVDNGETWSLFLEISSSFRKLRISPSGKYYLFEGNKIRVSGNSGASWSDVSTEFSPDDFELKGETIFIINEDHLAASENDGVIWESISRNFGTRKLIKGKDGKVYILAGFSRIVYEPILIFEITSNPVAIDQVGAAASTTVNNMYFGNNIWWASKDTLYRQGELIEPVTDKNYMPLHESNEYLYVEREYFGGTIGSRYKILERKTSKDTVINGMQYYRFSDDTSCVYAYNESENSIYKYDTADGVRRFFYMNYQPNYIQPAEAAFTDQKFIVSTIQEPSSYNTPPRFTIYKFNQGNWPEYSERIEFVDKIGIMNFYDFTTDTTLSTYIYQAKTYLDGQVYKYDYLDYPSLSVNDQHKIILLNDKLHVEFKVYHDLIENFDGGYYCIIDSAWIEYYYKDYPNKKYTKLIPLKKVYHKDAEYAGDVLIDLSKIGDNGEKFRFKFHAVTLGPMPKETKYPNSSTSWLILSDYPTALEEFETPLDYSLSSNYPNPFNPSTKMEFSLPEESDVNIAVYNVTGEKLFTAAEGNYKSGSHEVNINMSDYSSGVYFVRMIAGDKVFTNKIMLLK